MGGWQGGPAPQGSRGRPVSPVKESATLRAGGAGHRYPSSTVVLAAELEPWLGLKETLSRTAIRW
jgi:hypothetical protein